MGTVPQKPLERLQWYENHVAPFTTNAVAIGITSTEATDLATKCTTARTLYNAHQAALDASKTCCHGSQRNRRAF